MKIKQKLTLVFIMLASLVGCVGYLAIDRLEQMTNGVIQINKSSVPEVGSSTEMEFEFVRIVDLLKEYSHQTINDDTAATIQKLNAAFSGFEKALILRKAITANGLKLYTGRELESEIEELERIKILEKKYHLYKKESLANIAPYAMRSNLENKLNGKEWKQKESALNDEIEVFKKGAQEEITSETVKVINEVKTSAKFLYWITGLALLVAIVAGIITGRSIIAPILALNAGAKNISQGKMDTIKVIQAKDEIGDLTVSFNLMATHIEASRKKLEQYNSTLEQKVQERTKELEENILKLTETEDKLKAHAKSLKASNMELEQFAYVASHDLQEPLRTCSSYVEVFRRQYDKQLDEKADKYLGYITESSERMIVLIKDLLDFSRIGQKRELKQLDCNVLLQEVLMDLEVAINESKAKIKFDPLPVINGYSTEIKQLFQNLLTNAIKFRKKNVPPQIKISAKCNHEGWEFTCQDNGIGIDEENLERVFIIFQRLHTRKEYAGSGIGLAHCKKIVELHGGTIWIDSMLGRGTTFHFTIFNNNSL